MTDGNLDISRRKVLGAMGTIGGAAALGGASTMAFFSDEEEFANNELVAGELDLKIDWEEHYSDWMGDETQFASMDSDGMLVVDDVDGFMGATLTEAFPDEDNNGVQDDITQPVCAETSNLADADLPDALSSDLRTNGTFAGQETGSGDPLVDIQDVKPGDSGEITFSLHLCDNPGYIWLTGNLVENAENGVNEAEASDPQEDDEVGGGTSMSGELAEEILVQAWYDPDCDNVFDGDESIIFAEGTLETVMQDLQNGGIQLDASKHDGGTSASDGQNGGTTSDICEPLGKLEWTGTEFDVESGSNDSKETDNPGAVGDVFRLVADDGTGRFALLEIEDVEFKDDDSTEPIRIEFDIIESSELDGNTDDDGDIGICQIDVKASNDTQRVYDGPLCITGAENISTESFVNQGGQQPAISNIQFYYCTTGEDGGGGQENGDDPCFDPGQKYCVGFEWRLPANHANEIQTDSVSFDLGFYTEQCRHNDGSGIANTNG